jgi:hypothetical protein
MRQIHGVASLIDDMHKAFDAVCAKLRLATTSDKATEFVASKIVELAKAGRRGEDLTEQTLKFFETVSAGTGDGPTTR